MVKPLDVPPWKPHLHPLDLVTFFAGRVSFPAVPTRPDLDVAMFSRRGALGLLLPVALLDLVGFEFIRDEVEPGSHTVASSSDLQLNHRRRLLVIGPAQFLPYDFVGSIRQNCQCKTLTMSTDICVALSRPRQRRAHDIVEVNRLQPLGLLISELASLDLLCKSISPSLGVVIWSPPRSADELLSNGAIPYVMQVELLSLPQHVDTITSPRDVFVMQRLVN
ncbi:hypothetical protein BN1708_015027, partial [Verticillium longisporum]